MIARLRGEVLETLAEAVVLDVQGVGYLVNMGQRMMSQIPAPGATVDLHIRHIQREDEALLYGFMRREQRELFDLLRSVKGCGARISQQLLSSMDEGEIMGAVAAQDHKLLTKAPGVGPKLAQRIVLELKDKATKLAAVPAGPKSEETAPAADDLVMALLALGYRREEAEQAAEHARNKSEDLQAQVRAALKILTG